MIKNDNIKTYSILRTVIICCLMSISCGILALLFKSALFNVYIAFNGDSLGYIAFGKFILNGMVPYSEYWDHKTPLIHYLSFLSYYLSGQSFAGGILASIIAHVLIFSIWFLIIARRNLLVASIYAFTYAVLAETNHEWVFMPELFSLLFTTIAVYLFFRNDIYMNKNRLRLCAGGFFLFSSFFIKQLVVFDCIILIILAIHIIYINSEFKAFQSLKYIIFWILSGAAIGLLTFTLPLVIWGNFQDALECFLHNFKYSEGRLGLHFETFDTAHLLPVIGSYLCIIFIYIQRCKEIIFNIRKLYFCTLLVIWTTGAWYMSSGTHHHYLITIWNPFLFSLFTLSKCLNTNSLKIFDKIKLRYLALSGILLLIIIGPKYFNKFDNNIIQTPEFFSTLNESAKQGDTYFAFSSHNGSIMLHLDLVPSQKYVYLAPIAHSGGDFVLKEIKESLVKKPPNFLLIADLDPFIAQIPNFVSLHEFIHCEILHNYERIPTQAPFFPMTNTQAAIYKKKNSI